MVPKTAFQKIIEKGGFITFHDLCMYAKLAYDQLKPEIEELQEKNKIIILKDLFHSQRKFIIINKYKYIKSYFQCVANCIIFDNENKNRFLKQIKQKTLL